MKGPPSAVRRCAILLVAALLLASPGAALTQGGSAGAGADGGAYATARLHWERAAGAESCLDGEALRRAVNERWGREVIGVAADTDLTLRGRVEGRPGRWGARFELLRRDGSSVGSRELATAASHCSALDDALALATGLMLDLSLRKIEEERRAAPPAEGPSSPPTAVPRAESPIRLPADTGAPRAPVRIEPRAGGEVELGLLPSVALGARAGLSLEVPAGYRAGVAFAAWLPSTVRASGAGVEVSAYALELSVCAPMSSGGTLSVHLCAAQRLGRASAEGLDLPRTRSSGEPFATAGASLLLTLPLSEAFLVGAGLRTDAALLRYRFVYDSATGQTVSVHEMSPVSAGVMLEAGLRF